MVATPDGLAIANRYRALVTGFILLLLCLVYLGHAAFYWDWIVDDAFITLRYAANVVDGQGFVFNVGERVEGYSNFSWVLLSAAAIKAGLDPLVTMRLLGIASGLLCLPLAWALSRRFLGSESWAALVAPAVLAITPPMARHATTGLETLFFTLLLLLALWFLQSPSSARRNLALVAVLWGLTLTRPEGFVFAFVLLLPLVPGQLAAWFGQPDDRPFKTNGLVIIAGFVLLGGAFFLWRWSYFGEFLPNTYYAKMTGDPGGVIDGIQYGAEFLRNCIALPLLALALVPCVIGQCRPIFRHLLLVLMAYGGFVVAAGGDWMMVYRLFVPVLPLLAVGSAAGLGELFARLPDTSLSAPRWRLALLCGVVAALSTISTFNYEVAVWRQVSPELEAGGYLVSSYRDLGCWLAENTPENATIAVSDIGAIGYFSKRQIVDMFGLVDKHIARRPGKQHGKTDTAYILARNPDFIVLVRTEGQGHHYLRLPDGELWRSVAFRTAYSLTREFPMPGTNELIEIFERKQVSVASSSRNSGYLYR